MVTLEFEQDDDCVINFTVLFSVKSWMSKRINEKKLQISKLEIRAL